MLISKLQITDSKDWSGMTTENHWGALYQQSPILLSNVAEMLYKVNLGGDDIVAFMNKFPKRYIDDDLPYQWLLQGADEKNIPILGYYSDSTMASQPTKAGVARSVFYMEFGERLFSATDVIVGEKPDLYKLRIVNDLIPTGATFLAPVQLVTGDDLLFVPAAELAAGKRWSKEYSLTEQTLSKRGGDVTHTSPFRMENVMSSIRKQYLVPGNMIRKGANKPMAFSWIDPVTKKKMTSWLGMLDWAFISQFRREVARLIVYGNSNKMADGTFGNLGESGYEIRAGFGIQDQVAPSNIFSFNKFDIDWICQLALGLSVGKLPEDERLFVLSTGEYGAYDFHVAASENSSAYTPNFSTDRIVMKGDGKMTYRGQFMEYHWINGIKFQIFIDPMKDDPVRNKLAHPEGGLASSHSFDIYDFGTAGGEPNIQRVAMKGDEEIYKYIPGMRDPYTPYDNLSTPSLTSNGVDGYEVLKMFIGGAQVKNPMRCARLLPNILS